MCITKYNMTSWGNSVENQFNWPNLKSAHYFIRVSRLVDFSKFTQILAYMDMHGFTFITQLWYFGWSMQVQHCLLCIELGLHPANNFVQIVFKSFIYFYTCHDCSYMRACNPYIYILWLYIFDLYSSSVITPVVGWSDGEHASDWCGDLRGCLESKLTASLLPPENRRVGNPTRKGLVTFQATFFRGHVSFFGE